jgi:hypothetical protein
LIETLLIPGGTASITANCAEGNDPLQAAQWDVIQKNRASLTPYPGFINVMVEISVWNNRQIRDQVLSAKRASPDDVCTMVTLSSTDIPATINGSNETVTVLKQKSVANFMDIDVYRYAVSSTSLKVIDGFYCNLGSDRKETYSNLVNVSLQKGDGSST